jgi:D-alanyl-D-alanine carboxypeptidase/D-alanyl-D-alanine-endopeptidase (penicillin-binding protein 4)
MTIVVPPAFAVAGSIELVASDTIVELDHAVTISGTLTSSAGCTADRALFLDWRAADSSAFATVDEGTTAVDGTFTFEQVQQYTGRYRVTALAEGACDLVVSDTVLVRVRARVDSTVLAGSLEAGSCVDVDAAVMPPKPGQSVELQQRAGGGWTTLGTLILDADSHTSARPCFGWEDVGIVRLRVRWPAQDQVNAAATGPTLPFQIELASWMRRIEDLVAGRSMSISVGEANTFLYEHAPAAPRTPASNEKLLLSMALLDTLGPDRRIRTFAASKAPAQDGVIEGNLWILGRGDPQVNRTAMADLAASIVAEGVTRIDGHVTGSTTYFRRDWDAPGWNAVARDYVARPTALTYDGNLDAHGRDDRSPETLAAKSLTAELEALGVKVGERPNAGEPPGGLVRLASTRSRTLRAILAKMLRPSNNFYAEVLGKGLGVTDAGTPGTIAKGAAALETWVDRTTDVDLFDCSGLSYANRVTAEGIVRLLWLADAAPWHQDLFDALPSGGQGTLRHRFADVEVRAKTGTLTDISALSGWVRLERTDSWAEFSILSSGMTKTTASDLEDHIVRIIQNQAR